MDTGRSTPTPPVVISGEGHRAAKQFYDGTHRTCSPEETLERIRPHFGAIGITRLADVTGLDRIPISTVIAMRPNSRTLANGSGKGFTKVAATVSAAMETIEHHHAELADDTDVVRATHAELAASDRVVAVEDLLLTKDGLFSEHRPEQWVQGWDIVSNSAIYVPFDCVNMGGARGSLEWTAHSFQVGSNGLAAGNVLLEAVTAALYECIERDATTIRGHVLQSAGIPTPRIDLDSVTQPRARDLIDRLAGAGIRTLLYDCTIDTNVPTYLAEIYDERKDLGHYKGYGTHLDPEIAMIRAITEAVQARVVYVAGSRDDVFDHTRQLLKLRSSSLQIERLEGQEPEVDVASLASAATATFEADIATLVERVRAVGRDQVIVVDLTKQELGIPVVRVLVPGFEGYPFGFYRPGWRARAFCDARGVPVPS